MAIKLEVFSLGRDVLSGVAQGIDLYTSAKFRAFNTSGCKLNNSACFLHHFPATLMNPLIFYRSL